MEEAPTIAEGYPRPFGSYVLLTAFAHGGMGEVYLAKTGGIEGIERVCVLKKLRPDFGQNPEYVNRFLDEARLVVQLNHANIAHVFDVGRVAGEYYLAMEYVSGVSLRGLMTRALESGSPLPVDVSLFVLCESLEALDYAHRLEHPMTGKALNLVHRDVSPHNVMVSYEGEVKLIDFGLAASELKEEQTESQVVMGKVAYMSPEQARGDRVDGRCDQFAAGIIAYELLAHDRYYGEMSNYQIWQVVGRGGFTPRGWGLLDKELQPILSRALHGDPTKRYPSCGDFKEALLDWLVARHPKTGRRTVREAVRALSGGDTEKERTFLQRVTSVSAAETRAGNDPVASTQSYSIIRAPGSNPPAPSPGFSLSEKPDTEPTNTHLIPKQLRKRARARRRALAASLALVVLGGAAGFALVRAGRGGEDERRVKERAAHVARTAPEARDEERRGDKSSDDSKGEVAAAEANVADGSVARAEENAAAPSSPDETGDEEHLAATAAGEERDGAEVAADRSRQQKNTKTTTTKSGSRTRDTPANGAERDRPASAEPQEASAEPAATAKSEGEALVGWRARVVRRLESCPPCAKTFLERANLRTLPAEKLEQVRVSVETCLKQCE